MAYVKVSIPKSDAGAGVALPKDPTIVLIDVEDVTAEPTRSLGNTQMTGNYTLGTSAKAVGIYATPSSVEAGYESAGEADARGFIHSVAFEHPGDSAVLNNFIEAHSNKGVIALVKNCDGTSTGYYKAYGTKCNPLMLTSEPTDNKDGIKTKLSFKQEMAQKFVPGFYTGTVPSLADAAAPSSGSGSGSGSGTV